MEDDAIVVAAASESFEIFAGLGEKRGGVSGRNELGEGLVGGNMVGTNFGRVVGVELEDYGTLYK